MGDWTGPKRLFVNEVQKRLEPACTQSMRGEALLFYSQEEVKKHFNILVEATVRASLRAADRFVKKRRVYPV